MKHLLYMVVMLFMSVTTFAQNSSVKSSATTDSTSKPTITKVVQPTITNPYGTTGYLCNPPLPYKPDSLNVIFIGNSFSIDTATGLPPMLKDLKLKKVNVYVLYKGGCSLKQHYEYLKSREKVYELHRFNSQGTTILSKSISINEVLSMFDYDVVIFQQYSMDAGKFETYEPYLSKLIQAYNATKIGGRTTFAFNETWAVNSKKKEIATYGSQDKMYKSICQAVKSMRATTGIDVIIPCGTAVQNARKMKALITRNELNRDDIHLDLYMGRYLASCTFVEAILAPIFDINLRDTKSNFGKKGDPSEVTFANRDLLKKCARLAVANNYEVSEFVNE